MKNWANELNSFFKGRSPNDQKHMKICSASLAIKEMQIKTTLRFYFTFVGMATIKNTNNNTCWLACRQKGAFIHFWWECKLVQPQWKTVWRLPKETKDRTAL
jgi:hypothetical protein